MYILGDYYNLYCLNAENGAIIWTYPVYGGNCPAVVNDKVYVGNYGGGIFCLNATIGSFIWSFDESTDYQGCSPAVSNGNVYIGSGPYNEPGTFYCLDADTGDEVWSFDAAASIWSSPAVVDGKVYFDALYLYCLDADTGDSIWSYSVSSSASPAVAYGCVYIPGSDGDIYCFNADTGDVLWTYPTGGPVWEWVSPAVADEKVYVGTHNGGNLLCLDAYDGDLIWEYNLCPQHIYSSPAVAYGNVYIGSGTTGDLIVFGTPNQPPETPTKPDGPDNGLLDVEYLFNSSSTDPEDDDIYYLFDWGDGTNSGWQGPYASGVIVNASHIWTEVGDYEIGVKAHDGRRESNWSESFTISITSLPPDAPSIDGPTKGNKGVSYNFTFNSVDPDGDDVYYYIKWGDGCIENWDGPHHPGEDFVIAHSYTSKKTFTIEAKAKDTSNAESNWAYFDIKIPRTKASSNLWFQWFLEHFPILRYIFRFQ